MRKSILILLFFLTVLEASNLYAQNNSEVKHIEMKNELWNDAFNQRDTTSLFSLFEPKSIIISESGQWVGKEKIKNILLTLFKNRPDIEMTFKSNKIEVMNEWNVAYETGTWIESWTEKGDSGKSTIKGKYWKMYLKQQGQWYLNSLILTPLSCEGSYCNK
jgi:ketosteroid isomerase-like protein